MSRFRGWTSAAVNSIGAKNEIRASTKKINTRGPDYVSVLCTALSVIGIPHEREYRFLHDRRFRFDIAIPQKKIAVEFEGGIFSFGRHTRGAGFANDAKKYNLAVMHGWRLLRYTSADVREVNWEFRAAEEIKSLMEQ